VGPPGPAPPGHETLDEPVYDGIARLVATGAPLDAVQSYIETRSGGSSEEERSVAWLRDWLAWERVRRPAHPSLDPLE
jgi:hypothetical protein